MLAKAKKHSQQNQALFVNFGVINPLKKLRSTTQKDSFELIFVTPPQDSGMTANGHFFCSILEVAEGGLSFTLGTELAPWLNRAKRSKDEHAMSTMPPLKRDILVSIHPTYAAKILSGQKTVELRRKFPEASAIGATVLIYSTSPVQAIVGYARIKNVLRLPVEQIWQDHGEAACLERHDFDAYFDGLDYGFAILLGGVKTLKRQLNALELRNEFGFVPPQSFRYLDEGYTSLLSNEPLQTPYRHKHRHRA